MRLASTAIALSICGCAQPIMTPEHITDWRRIRGVQGFAFLPHRGSGELLLRAGRFCGLQKEAQFQKQADAWSH
jgi:hypothetical protein